MGVRAAVHIFGRLKQYRSRTLEAKLALTDFHRKSLMAGTPSRPGGGFARRRDEMNGRRVSVEMQAPPRDSGRADIS
jgi:hypothetical protein